MRFSRLGLFVFILSTVLIGTNCNYYNRIIARKNLVDGAAAYQGRKFQEAQGLFREAVARDPQLETIEGKTAQLFLARTLHSEYIGNRKNTDLAEQAIAEYQKVLKVDPKDQSAYKAVANLYENLGKNDEWLQWVTARTTNEAVPQEQRAEALTSLAAKKNSCANDISDIMIRIEDIIEKVEKNRPEPDIEIDSAGVSFSALHHRGQKRASGEPYLVHPLEVADILADMRLDEVSAFRPGCCTMSSKIRWLISIRSANISAMKLRGSLTVDENRAYQQSFQRKTAGGKRPQNGSGDDYRRARRADQTRRPPAQYADDAVFKAGKTRPHFAGNARYLRADRAPSRNGETAQRTGRFIFSKSLPGRI
jgi:tetratricopeptide (TPR) repeat protein